MDRREILIGSGVALATTLAGCTGGGDDSDENGNETDGNGDDSEGTTESLYSEDDHEDMLLSIDAFPSGWERNDEFNENFDAVFTNEDESIIVLAMIEIDNTVEDAKDNYEQSESGTRDPQDYDIGDEAFWDTENDEIAVTLFRHSNAVGQVAAVRESGMEVVPDQSRSQQYAQEMFEGWSEI